MKTEKGGRIGDYVVLFEDWRGRINVRLYRRCSDLRQAGLLQPFHPFVAEEFSREDYHYLVEFVDGYLEGYEEEAIHGRLSSEAPDFLHEVESDLVLYGYHRGEPFEFQFEDEEQFTTMREELRARLGPWRERLLADLQWHRSAHSLYTIPTLADEATASVSET